MAALRPLPGPNARQLEVLLALAPWSLRKVDRAAGGAYRLSFRGQKIGNQYGKRTLRIPSRRIHGYQPRSPVDEPTRRARARLNKRSFSRWIWWRVSMDCPAAVGAFGARAFEPGALDAIDELRALLILLADGGADRVDLWLAAWEAA